MGFERLRHAVHVKHSQTLITYFFKGSNVSHEEGVSYESVSSCKCTRSSAPSNSSSSFQSIHRTPPSKRTLPWSFTSACYWTLALKAFPRPTIVLIGFGLERIDPDMRSQQVGHKSRYFAHIVQIRVWPHGCITTHAKGILIEKIRDDIRPLNQHWFVTMKHACMILQTMTCVWCPNTHLQCSHGFAFLKAGDALKVCCV